MCPWGAVQGDYKAFETFGQSCFPVAGDPATPVQKHGPQKVGILWREAGLSWKEFLPEGQDVGAFITEQKVEYTLGEESEALARGHCPLRS